MKRGKQLDELGNYFRHGNLVAHRFYLIVSIFAVIIFLLLALDRFQAYALSSARAYVAGEGYWSKGQKDAVFHLLRYAATGDEAHYLRFQQGIGVSLGDRQARLTMQSDSPDLELAREGFLTGRNHADDVGRMISLFMNFGDSVPEMRQAIAIWTEADTLIDKLIALGTALHKEIASGRRDPARINAIIADVDQVNEDVSKLENRFSATLGNASRRISRVAGNVMFASALLLLLTGIYLSRRLVLNMRRTADALVTSEARFRRIVQSNIIGIGFWDEDGSINDANDALLTMLGFTREEMERGEVDWWKLTPEEDQVRTVQALQEIRRHGYCAPFEKEFFRKDGSRVPVYISASRFENSESGGVSFLLDITEHKRAEQEQRVAATVFHATKEAILVTDSDAAIKAVNPAFTRITGYEPDDVTGRNPNILSSGLHTPEFFASLWEQLLRTGSWKGEICNRRKNGELYQGWLSITAIYDDKGEISEYVSVFSDITEQRRLEEQLRQSQKMEAIGTLVGGIAHDFNNTLAAMEGNLFLAKQQNGGNRELAEKLDNLDRLSDHSADMVHRLLTFARKDIVRRKPLSLNTFFHDMAKLSATIIPENIALDMQVCEEPLAIRGDATQLQQVIFNLLTNAIDAVADRKKPVIVCQLEAFTPDAAFSREYPKLAMPRLAHVRISDNGVGISKDELEHVFEPFFTTKEVGKGTGLGLSMAYGAALTHEGTIEIDSKIDKGTTVHLYLPLIDEPLEEQLAAPQQPEKKQPVAIAPEQPLTVLLVDDNRNMRIVSAEALGSLGYTVLTADNGINALACFEEHQDEIGLVITDVVMPGMGGYQAAKGMRAKNPSLPVIFMTGYDPEQSPVPARLAKNSEILSKPFSVEELTQTVQQLLHATTG